MSSAKLVSTLTLWEPPPNSEADINEPLQPEYYGTILLTRKRPTFPEAREKFYDAYKRAFEYHMRSLVATLSAKIILPRPHPSLWMNAQRTRALLSPTIKKNICFSDRRQNLWSAVIKYFEPIEKGVNNPEYLDFIAWPLYLLILATKQGACATFNLKVPMANLERLKSENVAGEAGARLALINSIFSSYKKVEKVPGLMIVPDNGVLIGDRLCEILEDAYLLEASSLRKFFGVASNRAAIRRDLRKLVNILTRRSWAKNLVQSGAQLMATSTGHEGIGTIIGAITDSVQSSGMAPPIIDRTSLEMNSGLPAYSNVTTHYRLVTRDYGPYGNSRLCAANGFLGTPNF